MSSITLTEPLALAEHQRLAALETIIQRGVQTFIEVGEALAEIREMRLYRESHTTFDAYCRERWGIGSSRARQLIGGAETARMVESVTRVTPASEKSVRPLAGLAPDEASAVYQQAVDRSDGQAPTTAQVRAAAAEHADRRALNEVRKILKSADQWGLASQERQAMCDGARALAGDIQDAALKASTLAEIDRVARPPTPEPILEPEPAPPLTAPWRDKAFRALRVLAGPEAMPDTNDGQATILHQALDLVAAMATAQGLSLNRLVYLLSDHLALVERDAEPAPAPPQPPAAIELTFEPHATEFDRRLVASLAEQLAQYQAQPTTPATRMGFRNEIEGIADAVDDATYDRLWAAYAALERAAEAAA